MHFKLELGLLGFRICNLFNRFEKQCEVFFQHLILRIVQDFVLLQLESQVVLRLKLALVLLQVQLIALAQSLIEVRYPAHHVIVLAHALNKRSHLGPLIIRLLQVQAYHAQFLLFLAQFHPHSIQLLFKLFAMLGLML